MQSQKETETALDATFYPQMLEDGTVTVPPYPFNYIVASEIIVSDVGMQDIIVNEEGVRAKYFG
jgi:hypothetical protein